MMFEHVLLPLNLNFGSEWTLITLEPLNPLALVQFQGVTYQMIFLRRFERTLITLNFVFFTNVSV